MTRLAPAFAAALALGAACVAMTAPSRAATRTTTIMPADGSTLTIDEMNWLGSEPIRDAGRS